MVLGLPHARGGVSTSLALCATSAWSSPRPWGCFPYTSEASTDGSVFPTPVGVFPTVTPACRQRGRLPHARGGVSPIDPATLDDFLSSPRPWGCFSVRMDNLYTAGVFPTPVGVFPTLTHVTSKDVSLPHARGGVSQVGGRHPPPCESSPRPWGCFPVVLCSPKAYEVFPTPVGVFPTPH